MPLIGASISTIELLTGIFFQHAGFIFVSGLVGNGIVVAVITALRRRREKSSVRLFLLHLAISDLMVCLLCIPLTIYINFHYPTEYHKRDHGMCKLSRFIQVLPKSCEKDCHLRLEHHLNRESCSSMAGKTCW